MPNRFMSLDTNWFIAKDENDQGRSLMWQNDIPSSAIPAYVPSIITQFFPNYHGVCYYWCRFSANVDRYENGRVLLRFGGVDYKADVWLNGNYVGCDESGETPFSFDVTDVLTEGENLLAVRVVNPCEREIDGLTLMNTPHRNKVIEPRAGSSLNHGGIWYGVTLEALPRTYITDSYVAPDAKTGEIAVELSLGGASAEKYEIDTLVFTNGAPSALVSSHSCTLEKLDSKTVRYALTLDQFKLWDVDDPVLYRIQITLRTENSEHAVTKRIGFREFHVKDGFFYLNGKRIFIRSSHSGNAFPVGEMHPAHSELLRRDFVYAKAAGFNMLRCIAGLFRPEQLDLADEIGLLIYNECFASWCMGYSQCETWGEGEFSKVQEKHPEIPLGDEQTMLAKWRHATDRMILRDRSHPSVVIWGLLNETTSNGVFREAVKYLSRARELDKTRVVVLNSGRFDHELSIGSASNPYSDVWENTWGIDGHPEALEGAKDPNALVGDNHHYAHVPLAKKEYDIFRALGQGTPAAFLSEMGIGPLFDVIDELRGYKMRGERLDLEDSAWLARQSEDFERDFYKLGLEKVFAFPERLLRESQRLAARDRKLFFDVVRSCDRISGYSLTGLLDHGMCGEGLFTFWRRWKPETFDAVSEGWAKVRFCLFVNAVNYRGVPLKIEAHLANDGVLASGNYHANFAVMGENGTECAFSIDFELDGEKLSSKILEKVLEIDLAPGQYKLVAELTDASCAACECEFAIMERPAYTASVKTFGIAQDVLDVLAAAGVTAEHWEGKDCDVLLLGAVDENAVQAALDAAERGAQVAFLDSASLLSDAAIEKLRKVIPDLSAKHQINWLYHKECVLLDPTVFRGIGKGLAPLATFTGSFPEDVFITDTMPTYPICPTFATGYYHAKSGYMLSYAMLGERFGKGTVLLSSYTLLSGIGHPTADTMLINVIKFLHEKKN